MLSSTCVGSEEAPVGDGHGDDAEDEADDAEEDHGPAVGRLPLPRPLPGPTPRSWTGYSIICVTGYSIITWSPRPPVPVTHRTCYSRLTSWSHAFPDIMSHSLLHFWKVIVSGRRLENYHSIHTRSAGPKSRSQFSHLLEIFYFSFSRFLSESER